MKPAVAGSPASPSIAIVSGQASSGRSAAQPLHGANLIAVGGFALAGDDHGKGGQVHERVDREVEDQRVDPGCGGDDDAAQHVAGLGDARVAEQPLQR